MNSNLAYFQYHFNDMTCYGFAFVYCLCREIGADRICLSFAQKTIVLTIITTENIFKPRSTWRVIKEISMRLCHKQSTWDQDILCDDIFG